VRIVLVRHAEPQVSATMDPQLWPLSAAGRAAAGSLRGRLPGAGRWVASSELKAYQTLQCARPGSVAVSQEARFDEVRRVEPFDDDARTRRRAWVDGRLDERHRGWETPPEAAARFDEAVRDHVSASDTLVVGSHGMVLTAWLVHARGVLAAEDAGPFWEALAFPDVIEAGEL
jgi:broad specificity phosphatase PhoE